MTWLATLQTWTYIGVSVVTRLQEKGVQQVAQLCDEVEVGNRNGEL